MDISRMLLDIVLSWVGLPGRRTTDAEIDGRRERGSGRPRREGDRDPGLFHLGLKLQLPARGGVGDAEVQLRLLDGPGFVDAWLLLEWTGGRDGDDGVFGRFGRDFVQLALPVTPPLPRGYDKAPHGRALYLLERIM
jgi:hypothetical protein